MRRLRLFDNEVIAVAALTRVSSIRHKITRFFKPEISSVSRVSDKLLYVGWMSSVLSNFYRCVFIALEITWTSVNDIHACNLWTCNTACETRRFRMRIMAWVIVFVAREDRGPELKPLQLEECLTGGFGVRRLFNHYTDVSERHVQLTHYC